MSAVVASKMGDVEELEVQEIDLDDEDFSCEVTSDDEGTAAVEQEVGIIIITRILF